MKKKLSFSQKNGYLLGLGMAAGAIATPFAALAAGSNSVSCAALPAAKSSAAQWFSIGRAAGEEGYLNTAYFAMDRAIRDSSANAATTAAALACLSQIEAKNGLVDLPTYGGVVASITPRTKAGSEDRRALESFAFRGLVQAIAEKNGKSSSLAEYEKIFAVAGPYRASAQALLAVAKLPAADARVANLIRTALIEMESEDAPTETKSLRAPLLLSLARNLYATGANAAAIAEYEKLFKIGQPMQDALIESAWAQLRSKNYVKSIGIGYELSTSKLSEFFAPEALSIRAISFVENCRYSEARNTIAKFQSEYRPLEIWLKSASSQGSLYEMAVARSEGALGKESVPEKAWSVWSSSNTFVATQNAIQKSFAEEREVKEWISDLEGSAAMKAALISDAGKIPALRTRAATRIENRLAALNRSMLSRLAAENERLRFVGIEANQGAGRDLVYRNANPGIADVEKDLAKEERKAKSYRGKLAWGKAKKDDPAAEMWVDEIGAFEAHTLNRCGAKAKYQELRAAL